MRYTLYLSAILVVSILFLGALSVEAQAYRSSEPKVSILDKDRRLNREISLEYSPMQGSGLLKSLWSKTGCEFTAIGGAFEFPIDFFTVLAKNVTVRDMMESYACFYRVKWQKTKLGYALITGNGELEAVYAPKNQFGAARDAASMEFVHALEKSPQELQNQVHSSLPFGSLPPDMQHSFKKMIATLENEYGENGGYKTGVLSSKMSMATISMTTKTDAGITCYDYSYSAPGEAGGFSTSDYEASKARRESDYNNKSRTGGIGAVYDPDKFDLTQKELNDLPALKRLISLNVINATCWQVLKLIHDKYKISVICRDPKETKQKANIRLNSVTLLEALRSLEKTYENTRWIWMRNSFLVVRRRDLNVIHGVSQPEGGIKLR